MNEKIGRLKADPERDCVRVIVDGLGEIGIITQEDTEELQSVKIPVLRWLISLLLRKKM